jgi:glycosyltransferase involved in cell wall biosynthesis
MTEVGVGGTRLLEHIDPGERVELRRGSVAVCIPLHGAHELFVQCLRSVLEYSPPDVPVLVSDDASPDPASGALLEEVAHADSLRHRLLYLRHPQNVGFPCNVNAAFAALADADVVILNSDCIVGPEWLERLQDAAYCDSTVATASALTNNGTILSVPDRDTPHPSLPDHLDVDAIARLVAARSPRLRPRIPTAIGHCMYVRRQALELVGSFDPVFSPGYGEEVDFSQRCIARGLCHVAADDVFVYHRGAGSFVGSNALQEEHEELIRHRYPFYHTAVRASSARETGALPRALAAAASAMRTLSVTIDARFLSGAITGTQLQALELIHALWRTQRADLRVLVPRGLGTWARTILENLEGVELVKDGSVTRRVIRTDIVHRPSQLFAWPELKPLLELGQRYVVTQLDLIAYRNPTYHSSFTDWREYQRLTRLSLSLADTVVFMSEHARSDALAEDLVPEQRTRVVPLGVDHNLSIRAEARRPRAMSERAEEQFLLVLGTNFRHKNRVFALRLLESLQERHGWDGWLVFAGPHASHGTSAGDEAEFLLARPRVAERVLDLRAVDEEEKQWLLSHACGVVYPTTCEGFGLVPFEAAQHGTPCFFTWHTSLQESLPETAATLVPWAPAPSADAVAEVLADPDRRHDLIEEITAVGERLTWNRAAEATLDLYAETVSSPPRELRVLADERIPTSLETLTTIRDPEILDVDPRLYRALYALTTNRVTARPFVRGVSALYAAGYLTRHGHRPRPFSGDR